MKKSILILLLMFMLIMCSVIFSKAAIIVIEDDEEPDGTNVYSLSTNEYYIYVDEEYGEGYVYNSINDRDLMIGTCSILLVNNNIVERICEGNENSIGEIKIAVNGNVGVIIELIGEVNEIFDIGTEVSIKVR